MLHARSTRCDDDTLLTKDRENGKIPEDAHTMRGGKCHRGVFDK